MKPLSRGLFLCLASGLGALLLGAAPPAGPSAAEIGRLVKQLGEDDFDRREAATARLKQIGEPALDALREAQSSDDLEVRRRASRVFSAVETRLYPELRLTGHTDVVRRVRVSADGRRVLTASQDKTLRLWDGHTGKCLRVFEGHTDQVWGAALSADGKRVLSGSFDATVRLWDAATGKELLAMTGHGRAVGDVAFGPAGRALSGGSDARDLTARVWDLRTGKNVGTFRSSGCPVAYSGKARLAAIYGDGGLLRLCDLGSGNQVRVFTVDKGGLGSICFSPDGKRLLTVGSRQWRILDAESGKELMRSAQAQDSWIMKAAFSPDGKRVVSGDYTRGVVRVWDAGTGKELCKYQGPTGEVTKVAVLPDGNRTLSVQGNGMVTSVAFFPDGKRVASAHSDGTVRIWRAPR